MIPSGDTYIRERKQNVSILLNDKYQLRGALDQCIMYLERGEGMTTKYRTLKDAKKAMGQTEFVRLPKTK